MKLLFTIAHGYLPQGNGGAQKSIDQLARELMKRGHEVAVLASLVHEGRHALRFRIHAKLNQVVHRRRLSKILCSGTQSGGRGFHGTEQAITSRVRRYGTSSGGKISIWL